MSRAPATPRCASCFMPLTGWREYHPLAACDLFRRLQDPDAVRCELNGTEVAVDYKTRQPLQPEEVSEVGALRQRAPETREGGNAGG